MNKPQQTKQFLGYGRQTIDEMDVAAVVKTLTGECLTQGPAVEEFEEALAGYVGARYAVAVSSGTAALHIACLAAGAGPESVGIVPTNTFVATANSLLYCGSGVVLSDIDEASRSISPEILRRVLKEGVEADFVMPVYFAGLANNAKDLREVAGKRTIIADACHALGAKHEDGTLVGGSGYADMTVFSFHPVKPITTGEGGAIVTDSEVLYRRLKIFSNHGIERQKSAFLDSAAATEAGDDAPWYYEQQMLGYNYRMTDIQAALGTSQLHKIDQFIDRRKEIALHYDRAFKEFTWITPFSANQISRERSGHHLYVVEIDFPKLGKTRTQVMNELRGKGIGSQVHYIPIHRQPFYQKELKLNSTTFPNAEKYYAKCLSLPIFPQLTDRDIQRVVAAVSEVANQ